MKLRTFATALTVVLSTWPLTVAAAETLVVAAGAGSYQPGLAKSWSAAGDKVTFVLQSGIDGDQIASVLKERLAQAKVSLEDGKVIVAGIPVPALLEQLSTLAVTGGDADPLVALAGLGGSVPTGEGPEAGGSIRASKPTPLAALTGGVADSNAAEQCEADVVEVTRSAFPQVVLKLRLRRVASPLKGKLAAGKLLEAQVMLAGANGVVDFLQPATQRNLAAFYLKRGDRVALHAVEGDGGRMVLDWIERR